MVKIKSVAICENDCAGLTGTMLDIHFYNGQSLLLPLKSRQDDPAFLRLYQTGELFRPETNGNNICWKNGTKLTLEEVMDMVRGT